MIKRGSIYTMAAKGAYTGKPRPAIIVQNENLEIDRVVVVLTTTKFKDTPLIRVTIEPSSDNGLRSVSYAMCEKISTVPKANLGELIGIVDEATIGRIEDALLTVLGFAGAR
jgi:mRNA interferase MazF